MKIFFLKFYNFTVFFYYAKNYSQIFFLTNHFLHFFKFHFFSALFLMNFYHVAKNCLFFKFGIPPKILKNLKFYLAKSCSFCLSQIFVYKIEKTSRLHSKMLDPIHRPVRINTKNCPHCTP